MMLVEKELDRIQAKAPVIKCVVWDLDNTLWEGVLLEDEAVSLRQEVVDVIRELDRRGILNSISSKNDHDTAMAKLQSFGLHDYFLYPAINWNAKSASLRAIARSLNIGLDTIAFVDDQPFELEEVAHELPEVLTIRAADVASMPDLPRLRPRFITPESSLRRQMYLSDMERNRDQESFCDTSEAFLATLGMVFRIKRAQESDLQRAEELTQRTNQLNTTGYTYSYQELNAFRQSPDHLLYVASLEDKYGTYGTIGLALVELEAHAWTIKLLLMSCRVMSRGVGTILMNHIMNRAQQAGVRLLAEFVPNGRNRMMYVTYKFGGFRELSTTDDRILFESDLSVIQDPPAYVETLVLE